MEKIEHYPNIKRYREAKGISIDEMTKKSGISVELYKSIETGKSELDPDDIEIIAQVLDVPEYKLASPARELQNVRFRSNKKLNIRKLVILEVEHWLNEYNLIEELLEDQLPNPLNVIGNQIRNEKYSISEVAKQTREMFGLKVNEPISNIAKLLESRGIKVGEQIVESPDFFGLSVSPEDGGPAVVINTWHQIPVERWIFTAAHELGHLILHSKDFDIDQAKEGKVHEKEANTFASEFLIPNESFIKEWDDTYGMSLIDRVVTLKRIFRVSYKTILYRLSILFPNSGNIWLRFKSDYKKKFKKSLLLNYEPEALAKDAFRASFPEQSINVELEKLTPADFKYGRLECLVRKALENNKISFRRGAEILQLSYLEFRDLANSWYS